MIQKYLFEPMGNAKLKFTTFKTVFLMVISASRRDLDLQSLQLGEESVCVKNGFTFKRYGLAEQDIESHYGTKLFVPAFSENNHLDP